MRGKKWVSNITETEGVDKRVVIICEEGCFETTDKRKSSIGMTKVRYGGNYEQHSVPLITKEDQRWRFTKFTREKLDSVVVRKTIESPSVVASDGSVKFGKASYAVEYARKDHTGHLKSFYSTSGRLFVNPGTVSSYRAEARGAAEVFV